MRLLAIVAELVLAGLVVCWGVASARYPALWRVRGAHWWVGWTSGPVARTEGVGVALAGAGLALAGAAATVATPTTPPDRALQLTGLGLLVLAGLLLAVVHPTTTEDADAVVPGPAVAPGIAATCIVDPVQGSSAVPV